VNRALVPLVVAILAGQAPAPGADKPFALAAGDRVVLIGGTLVERDQSYGYLETRLIRRHPGLSLTFRNLGWSGDTVEGPSRARFGTVADGFKHLVDHVLALKPTVLVVGYGANEAFEGAAGLPAFRKGLDALLAALRPAKARLVLLAPNRQEDLGRPLPDPARHNADLALYRDALREAAKRRGAAFVDLFDALPDGAQASPRRPLTDDGIHFNAYGSWREAGAIERRMAPGPMPAWSVEVGGVPKPSGPVAAGTKVDALEATGTGLRFRALDAILPDPLSPGGGPELGGGRRVLRVADLRPGRHTLKVDGKPVAEAGADAWKAGVEIRKGPEFDQVEALRSVINAKNELYFYRWRPQNETYLFGFRKKEQGQNAREIPEFDPLVAEKEAEIARLRVPVPHVYELTREGEVGR